MSLETYDDLKSEIATYLNRGDLTSQIDTFIDLAEEHHRNYLRVRQLQKRAQASLSTSSKYLALPAGFLYMRVLRLLTTPVSVLQFVNEEEITRQAQSAAGKPLYFTIHEEIEFERVPDSEYSAEMIYYASPTPLSSSNQTNVVLTNFPALYLYGALAAAEPFLDNDDRLPVWKALYEAYLEGANVSDRKSRHAGNRLVTRVVMGERY